jgi:hypothetical protein
MTMGDRLCWTEQEFFQVAIIPGNRYFRLDGQSVCYWGNLPLEVMGREGRFHRVIKTCLSTVIV